MAINFPTDGSTTFDWGGFTYTLDTTPGTAGVWYGGDIVPPEPFMLTFPFTISALGGVAASGETPAEDMFITNNETGGFWAAIPSSVAQILLVFPSTFPGFTEGNSQAFLFHNINGTVESNTGLTATRANTYGVAATGADLPWVFGPTGVLAPGTNIEDSNRARLITWTGDDGVSYSMTARTGGQGTNLGNPVGDTYRPYDYTVSIV